MSDYTKATDFAAKDNLLTGNPSKLVRGTEIDTEFNAIAVAVATKVDAGPATASELTLNTSRILGRYSPGTGGIEELTISGATISSAGVITIIAGTGNVLSVSTATLAGQAVVFNSAAGNEVKAFTANGMVKASAGVLQSAIDGTDYVSPTGVITLTNKKLDSTTTRIADTTDPTKTVVLDVSNIGSATTATFSFPSGAGGTFALASAAAAAPGDVVLAVADIPSASAVLAIDFTAGINSAYEEYELLINLSMATATELKMGFSTNLGTTWDTNTGNYCNATMRYASAGTVAIDAQGGFIISLTGSGVNGYRGRATLHNPASTTTFKGVYGDGVIVPPNTAMPATNFAAFFRGVRVLNDAVNGIRLFGTHGMYGTVKLHGKRKTT